MVDKSIGSSNINESFLRDETLISIFKDSVNKFGDKTAITFKDKSLCFNELDGFSETIAQSLIDKGLKAGDIVGIYLPRGYDILVSTLAVLKAGAAYIPFDRETPIDRVKNVLASVNATYCFCDTELPEPLITCFPTLERSILPNNTNRINLASPDNYAYIIFTSGTTGTPKGIPIKHKQISHLLRSENSILKINETDKVYQGFSDSFDMWFEENWISLFAGAEICVADGATAKSLDTLHHFLNKNKITVLHAVPGLLAYLDTDIPTLRLINSGGEACKPNVLKKWGSRNLQFFNSYGPTETTVSATMIQLTADDEITIGWPLPNYGMAVVNEQLEPVAIGEEGEIVLSGICVSDGYINKPELTAKAFLPKPDSLASMPGDRIYLSGDKGTMTEDGRFKVIGRKDDQVKIRGYRVELGEIEVVLNSIPNIKTAAIAVKNIQNIDQLVAYYILLEGETSVDEKMLREKMVELLPAYMLPSYFMKVDAFKMLPSGKVDRKGLPDVVFSNSDNENEELLKEYEGNKVSESIVKVLATTFPGQTIRKESDFFNDLGGHSMLAAIFVSEVRQIAGLENISIIDIYQKRMIDTIINFWVNEKYSTTQEAKQTFHPIPPLRYFLCNVFQFITLILLFGLQAAQIFVPYLGYYMAEQEFEGHTIPILISIGLLCLVTPFVIGISILIKRIFIGKFKEGDYPLWGTYYFKWWLNTRLITLIQLDTFSSSPLYPFLMRLIGIKTNDDAQLNNFGFGAPDLITIGKNVTISANVILNNVWVEDGLIKFRQITLKDNCHIGTSCIINGGCVLEEGSELKDLSCLAFGETMQKNSCWEGSPAKFTHQHPEDKPYTPVSRAKRIRYKLIFSFIVFLFPALVMLPIVPTIIGLYYLDEQADPYSFYYLISTPLFALSYILLFIAELVIISQILQRGIKVGRYSVYSGTYVRKWFMDQLFSLSLSVLRPIFATVFISRLYRALGAKVGKNTEISNASNITHHLLEIGEESFIADAAVIGETDIRNQELIIEKTIIGNKSFVGNSALIPQGYHLGDNKLIGVTSIPPLTHSIADNVPSDWFGSPAVQLPRRATGKSYPDHLTYKPNLKRKLARTIIEFLRILVPETITLSLGILFIAYSHDLITSEYNPFLIAFLFPLYYIGIVSLPAYLFCLVLKWVFIGRYQEEEYPMWTWRVWRTEAVTSIFESLATPFLLVNLEGTAFLPFLMRLMGVKIGKRVWMNTADITEFDMVTLRDDCAFNVFSGPQTHLFEDRVMKIGRVDIGERSSIGAGSVVLYNTKIENNCKVGPLSLVMKGEHLLSNTNWFGIPIERELKK